MSGLWSFARKSVPEENIQVQSAQEIIKHLCIFSRNEQDDRGQNKEVEERREDTESVSPVPEPSIGYDGVSPSPGRIA
eukprot:gene19366-6603_t